MGETDGRKTQPEAESAVVNEPAVVTTESQGQKNPDAPMGTDVRRREVSFALAEKQFAELIRLKEPAKSSGVSLDDILKLMQMAALIIAALWTWREYREFRREFEQVQLERDKIDLRQRELTLTLTELDKKLKTSEVIASEQTPVAFEIETNLAPPARGSALAYAHLRIRATNTTKNIYNVKRAKLELLIGTIDQKSIKPGAAFRINGPRFDSGPVKWRAVSSERYISHEEVAKLGPALLSFGSLKGAPAFGRVIQGDTTYVFSVEYRVPARTSDWLAFIETFVVTDPGGNEHEYTLYQWRSVNEQGWQDMNGREIPRPQ